MSKISGETYRSIRLCVDSYEQGELKGRYYNLIERILLMDSALGNCKEGAA